MNTWIAAGAGTAAREGRPNIVLPPAPGWGYMCQPSFQFHGDRVARRGSKA